MVIPFLAPELTLKTNETKTDAEKTNNDFFSSFIKHINKKSYYRASSWNQQVLASTLLRLENKYITQQILNPMMKSFYNVPGSTISWIMKVF